MANIEELDRALKWIEESPELHDQSVWAQRTTCGTAMCLAGTVAALNGRDPVFSHGMIGEQSEFVRDADGNVEFIPSVAQRLLDLTDDQANYLFASDHSLADLKRARDWIAEGKL